MLPDKFSSLLLALYWVIPFLNPHIVGDLFTSPQAIVTPSQAWLGTLPKMASLARQLA
jgi:hypothetical protein